MNSGVEDRSNKFLLYTSFGLASFVWLNLLLNNAGISVVAAGFFFTGLFVASLVESKVLHSKTIHFSKMPKMGVLFVILLSIFLIGAVAMEYYFIRKSAGLVYYEMGEIALTNGQLIDAGNNFQKSLSFTESDLVYRSVSELNRQQISTNILPKIQGGSVTDQIKKDFKSLFDSSVSASIMATNYDKNNYLNWFSLAKSYAFAMPDATAYNNAKIAIAEAEKLNPNGIDVSMGQAELETIQGNTDNAAKILQGIILKISNYADAYYALSKIYVNSSNISKAIDVLQSGANIMPRNIKLGLNLGVLQYNSKQYTNAITSFTNVLRVQNDYADAMYYLALSYEKTGDKNSAIALYNLILRTNPGNQTVVARMQALNQPIPTTVATSTPKTTTKTPAKKK